MSTCPYYFCASYYKPRGTDDPRPWSTRASIVVAPARGRDQAPEAPGGVGTTCAAMLCASFSGPDEITFRALAPTRTAGASRCRTGTRRPCRFATDRGRGRTRSRTRDCAAGPRSAPTCFAMRPGAASSAGAPHSTRIRATTARAPRVAPAHDARCALARLRARARRRGHGRAALQAPRRRGRARRGG